MHEQFETVYHPSKRSQSQGGTGKRDLVQHWQRATVRGKLATRHGHGLPEHWLTKTAELLQLDEEGRRFGIGGLTTSVTRQ